MEQLRVSDNAIRVVLICHHDAPIHFDGIARWLASWSHLAGIVVIREPAAVLRRRVRREWRRVGTRGLIDVLAFRLYYAIRLAARDARWLDARLEQLRSTYAPIDPETRRIEVASPNAPESREFIEASRPDLIVALCKNILAERIFSIARHGTVVFHPGICPEYRNAHGCFWALASDDRERVGLTVLKIDKGIDSGPVLGYMQAAFDEFNDSHVIIQHKVLLDNLDAIRALLVEFVAGRVKPIDVTGRSSREWGQPWLSAWRRWKSRARRRYAADRA
ncbi:MAG TPA: formyltransferase family protein [Gemmatimonadaceae bacterium]